MKRSISLLAILLSSSSVFAATPVDLSLKPTTLFTKNLMATSNANFKEVSRITDANQTLHVRFKQLYQGYPVWGGDGISHIRHAARQKLSFQSALSNATYMNGQIYQDLEKDLANTSPVVHTQAQRDKALAFVLNNEKSILSKADLIVRKQIETLVYLDQNDKAHWAYKITLNVKQKNDRPQQLITIINASTFEIYKQWDNVKTFDKVLAGGFGGNHKTGEKIFDGGLNHLAAFNVERDPLQNKCYMQNDEMYLINKHNDQPMTFDCKEIDESHNKIYWNANHDAIETTKSPSNDVVFGATVTRKMFADWYHIPVLVDKDKQPLRLKIMVHDPMENAYWTSEDPDETTPYVLFGDSAGSTRFNAFTSLDTVGHEMAHGFTEQHSNLIYEGQSGGLNEAFSDMAGIAAEYFIYGSTDYLVGFGDVKAEDKALRYMEMPSKDCKVGHKPGDNCSIDNMKQYKSYMDVHYISGIFNRVYYNLAHSEGWNAKTAFDVMVQANMYQWTPATSYQKAACGVMQATKDLNYDLKAVSAAIEVVGLDPKACKLG